MLFTIYQTKLLNIYHLIFKNKIKENILSQLFVQKFKLLQEDNTLLVNAYKRD